MQTNIECCSIQSRGTNPVLHSNPISQLQQPQGSFREEHMRSDSQGNEKQVPKVASHGTNYKFPLAGRSFYFAGNYFCSRSEAACAALMAKYLGYEVRDGETFQVNIGKNKYGADLSVDYVIRGVVFEYHPVQKPKDPQYWKLLYKYPPGERGKFRRAWNNNETQKYYDKRKAQLEANPGFKDMELVVAQSPQEFYEKIILRFMMQDKSNEPWSIPALNDVVREFRKIQNAVHDLMENKRRACHVRVRGRSAA